MTQMTQGQRFCLGFSMETLPFFVSVRVRFWWLFEREPQRQQPFFGANRLISLFESSSNKCSTTHSPVGGGGYCCFASPFWPPRCVELLAVRWFRQTLPDQALRVLAHPRFSPNRRHPDMCASRFPIETTPTAGCFKGDPMGSLIRNKWSDAKTRDTAAFGTRTEA